MELITAVKSFMMQAPEKPACDKHSSLFSQNVARKRVLHFSMINSLRLKSLFILKATLEQHILYVAEVATEKVK